MRLMIVTAVQLYAEGLRRALSHDARFDGLEVAGSVEHALALLSTSSFDPDLMLIDLDVDEFERLRAAAPDARVVVLGIREREEDVLSWAERGIDGFVTPHASLEELSAVLEHAGRGETLCSPRMTAAFLRRIANDRARRNGRAEHFRSALTAREHEILGLLQRGLSNKAIARELHIELPTVKNHVHHILEKLDVGTRGEAVAHTRAGVVPVPEP
jgi:two-component system, NarL family, nitrate/nitrite response regulator NarL